MFRLFCDCIFYTFNPHHGEFVLRGSTMLSGAWIRPGVETDWQNEVHKDKPLGPRLGPERVWRVWHRRNACSTFLGVCITFPLGPQVLVPVLLLVRFSLSLLLTFHLSVLPLLWSMSCSLRSGSLSFTEVSCLFFLDLDHAVSWFPVQELDTRLWQWEHWILTTRPPGINTGGREVMVRRDKGWSKHWED